MITSTVIVVAILAILWYSDGPGSDSWQQNWPVGKVVNTSACHAEEHRFDPGTGRQFSVRERFRVQRVDSVILDAYLIGQNKGIA